MKEGEIRIQKLYVFCERGEERGYYRRMGEKKRTLPQRKTGTAGIVSALQGVLITAACSWIFYDSFWGMAWMALIVPFWCWLMGKRNRRKRRDRMQQECKELLQMLVRLPAGRIFRGAGFL